MRQGYGPAAALSKCDLVIPTSERRSGTVRKVLVLHLPGVVEHLVRGAAAQGHERPRSLEVVGERWSLLIIRNALFAGSTRYGDFRRSLGIATNVLQDRLDGFVEAGIMRRCRYSEQPELYEYLLTEKGRDLAPALIALTEWGDRWASPDGPPMLYRHGACGSSVSHELVCATCGRLDDRADAQARPGPGMPADRAERINRRVAVQTPTPGNAAHARSR
jgi:DNA-binding HxlR family transcriptional regulator